MPDPVILSNIAGVLPEIYKLAGFSALMLVLAFALFRWRI
jgi:hypothetical protein